MAPMTLITVRSNNPMAITINDGRMTVGIHATRFHIKPIRLCRIRNQSVNRKEKNIPSYPCCSKLHRTDNIEVVRRTLKNIQILNHSVQIGGGVHVCLENKYRSKPQQR